MKNKSTCHALWALVAFTLVISLPRDAASQTRVQGWVKLGTNYYDLYPRLESVFLHSMDRLTNGVGVMLNLRTSLPDLVRFEYSVNGEAFQAATNNRVPFAFDDLHVAKIYRATNTIRAITISGGISKPYSISVNYYPPELYAASGMTAPGYLIVQNTDLSLTRTVIEDWIVDSPTDADKDFARATWGALISPTKPDYENAQAIIKAILTSLNPRLGIPSDVMGTLSPFNQYRRALAGADRVWCGNIQSIFTYACNSLGIQARIVGMVRYGPPTPPGLVAPTLMLAEGHQTTEIFSKDLNAWVWMDTAFNILGGFLGDGGPVTIAEFHRLFNDPNRVKSIKLLVYNPVSNTTSLVSLLSSSLKTALGNYYKQDQEFYYLGWVTR